MSEAHPQRYPQHEDPEKGQVYSGECNVTRCRNRGAVYWNMGTYGLYCPECAAGINWRGDKHPLCVLVDRKPTLDAMEQLADELPETISLDDLQHHPSLHRLVLVSDDLANRVDYRALEWAKTQGKPE